MQIDHKVVPRTPQPPCEPEIRHDPRRPSWPPRHDQVVEVWITRDDRRGLRLHQVCYVRVRKRPLQRPRDRRREDDVANEPQSNQ